MLSPQEVADRLGIPVGSFYRWRQHGKGPKGYRLGRHIRFRVEDVDQWLEAQADEPAVTS